MKSSERQRTNLADEHAERVEDGVGVGVDRMDLASKVVGEGRILGFGRDSLVGNVEGKKRVVVAVVAWPYRSYHRWVRILVRRTDRGVERNDQIRPNRFRYPWRRSSGWIRPYTSGPGQQRQDGDYQIGGMGTEVRSPEVQEMAQQRSMVVVPLAPLLGRSWQLLV